MKSEDKLGHNYSIFFKSYTKTLKIGKIISSDIMVFTKKITGYFT